MCLTYEYIILLINVITEGIQQHVSSIYDYTEHQFYCRTQIFHGTGLHLPG